MTILKKIAALALALCVFTGCVALAEEMAAEGPYYTLGDTIEDFSVTTIDGQTVTLSALLQEKDMVLINLWATWCGPCEMEFPAMQAAYEQYSEHVAIVALSIEPDDTDEVLREYAASHGMTFYVGHDEPGLMDKFAQEGIPTSVVVDRNGVICFIECGSMPDVSLFTLLFDQFIGEDYEGPVLLEGAPRVKPTVAAQDPAELAAALETGTAMNPEDEYIWPMVTAEVDGRTVLAASNTTISVESQARVDVPLTVSAGDAIVVTGKVNTYPGYDFFQILVNEQPVKAYSGETDWFSYAIPMEYDAETVMITLVYNRRGGMEGADYVYVDSVALLSGDEAAAALAANPAYPRGDTISVVPQAEGARRIVPADEESVRAITNMDAFYIVPAEQADFLITINADVDPDCDVVFGDAMMFSNREVMLRDLLVDGQYIFTTGVDSAGTTGYPYSDVYLIYDGYEGHYICCCFADEENANWFFGWLLPQYGVETTWTYEDGTLPSTDAMAELPEEEGSYESTYTITYVDQNGDPVPGVTVQACDDATCVLYTTDDQGVVTFTAQPYAWEIHTLRLPEGYTGDTEVVIPMPVEGGELTVEVVKN